MIISIFERIEVWVKQNPDHVISIAADIDGSEIEVHISKGHVGTVVSGKCGTLEELLNRALLMEEEK